MVIQTNRHSNGNNQSAVNMIFNNARGEKRLIHHAGPKTIVHGKVIKETICEDIHQKCDGHRKIYWKSIGISPTGSVRIVNTSSCPMAVVIKYHGHHKISDELGQNQSITYTIKDIEKISITCLEDTGICTGSLALNLYYVIESLSQDKGNL